jgi:SAM-dependent methyltransferase
MPLPSFAAARLARTTGARVFGADAAGYAAGRIGYPAELYEAIARRSGNVESILEIGPGTGLATRALLDRFAPRRLLAVEADTGMAAHLRAGLDNAAVTIVTGNFLTAPIEESFDLAACAAAFHWLEPEPAFARLRILIRAGGTLALWWHSYRQAGIGDPFADAVMPLLKNVTLPPSEAEGGHYSLDAELHGAAITHAGFRDCEPALFRRERTLNLTELRALYASYSYIRVLEPDRRAALLDAIVDLGRRNFGGIVPNVVLSALYLATAP